jgi:hypothetical protein
MESGCGGRVWGGGVTQCAFIYGCRSECALPDNKLTTKISYVLLTMRWVERGTIHIGDRRVQIQRPAASSRHIRLVFSPPQHDGEFTGKDPS